MYTTALFKPSIVRSRVLPKLTHDGHNNKKYQFHQRNLANQTKQSPWKITPPIFLLMLITAGAIGKMYFTARKLNSRREEHLEWEEQCANAISRKLQSIQPEVPACTAHTLNGVEVEVPPLARNDLDELKSVLTDNSLCLLLGPPQCGKSRIAKEVLSDTKVVYLSAKGQTDLYRSLCDAFGIQETGPLSDDAVRRIIRKGLAAYTAETKQKLTLVVDDLTCATNHGFAKDVSTLVRWVVDLHHNNYANVKLISNDYFVVPALQNVSGEGSFSVQYTDYPNTSIIKQYLRRYLGQGNFANAPEGVMQFRSNGSHLSRIQIHQIVETIGGHLGDLGTVVAELRSNQSKNGKHLQEVLHTIVSKDSESMSNLFQSSNPLNLEKEKFEATCYTLFEQLTAAKKPIECANAQRRVGITVQQMIDVVMLLVRKNILRVIDGYQVQFYNPHQFSTWKQVRKQPEIVHLSRSQ